MAGTTGVPDFNGEIHSFNTDLKEYIDNSDGAFTQGAAVTNSTVVASVAYTQAELAAVVTKLNALLASLRAGGFIAP